MARHVAVVWCALVGMLVAASARADEPVTLRYKWDKDDRHVYRVTNTTKQTQTINNNVKIETEMTQNDIAVRTLQDVDDKGNFHVQTENKRLEVKAKIGPVGEFSFDSKSTERDKGSTLGASLTPLYESLSGAFLTVVHSPRGKVTEVKGFKELMEGALKDNPLALQFTGGGSDEAAKIMFAELFPELPEDPVKPGDKWEAENAVELPKLGNGRGKKIFTYEGPGKVGERETAKISVSYEISFDINIDMDGAKVTGNVSASDSSGTIHFDPTLGQVVSITSKYTLGGNLTVDAGGQTIPVQSEQIQSVSVEQLEKLPE